MKSVAVSTTCMSISAVFAFMISRYILRDWFIKFLNKKYPRFSAYNHAIEREGIMFIILMQFSLIPYSMLAYLFGITKVRWWRFFIGTFGMGIPNIFWCYVGSLLHNLSEF
jgi:uncharacterized membrane protein YdjX (TVP38/TMEM64 family)